MQIKIDNYDVLRSDRRARRGGGTLLYIHESLPHSNPSSFSDSVCEAAVCTIEKIDTIVASVYRPPNAPTQSFNNVLKFLSKYIKEATNEKHLDIHVMGDFNLPNIKWETFEVRRTHGENGKSSADSLFNFMSQHLLTQVVQDNTRGDNTLDIFLTNNDRTINAVRTKDTELSDHKIVKVILSYDPTRPITRSPPNYEPNTFQVVDIHNCDYELINEKLDVINWTEIMEDCVNNALNEQEPELIPSKFLGSLKSGVLDIFLAEAPRKPENRKGNFKFNHRRKILNRKRRKIERRVEELRIHNPSSKYIQKLEKELSIIQLGIRDSHTKQLDLMEDKAAQTIKSNPRYFYSYAKRFAKCKSRIGPLENDNNHLTSEPLEMGNILQTQYKSAFSNPDSRLKKVPSAENKFQCQLSDMEFTAIDIVNAIKEIDQNAASCPGDIPAKVLHKCKETLAFPLLLLWQASLKYGKVPAELKTQFITPIYKKGDKSRAENYRPVSLTSHIIKVFERVLRNKIVKYLESNNILTGTQHGFRKGRSCLSQLLDHVDHISKQLLNDNEVDIIYLDYAKAFDKVDHQILKAKLSSLGISGKIHNWISDFIEDRKQTVLIEGVQSAFTPVISGVPQGTVLGPILFLIYINDLVEEIIHCKVSSFADDTKLSRQIEDSNSMQWLQLELNNVIAWSTINNMDLNEKKFELLNYRTKKSLEMKELPFTSDLLSYTTPNGLTLTPSEAVRDLGIILTPDCQWTTHINMTADKGRKMASWTLGVFKTRSREIMLPLYKTMVRSHLEFSCPVWDPTKIEDIKTLESVQRTYTQKIRGCQDLNYWSRLKHLDLLSLQRRRERYTIIYTWKILNAMVPNDIAMKFYDSGRNGIKAETPRAPKSSSRYAARIQEQSFTYRAARLWNVLPKRVKEARTIEQLKIELGRFLKSIPDELPTAGYTTRCRNSIVEWSTQGGWTSVR